MACLDWIAEYEGYAAAEKRQRQLDVVARVIYPTGWGGGRGPVCADGKPNTARTWAGNALAALDKVTA